ncbi:serine/threonine-protein kinase RsbT [Thermosyntropha lipolytica DSM 11003]|uniref:Serine/threonine-protein kinase RsbT n=1 Tax=Thermosyntropha lipolytica DSM 11003 TaxID=1123382 RepID=A0A1M5L8X4_9FIRM|nr:anti-sigma regulatory factor [Thermosyntropha lipolytica]SHG61461.1 serine/threonine-protein kinase RsbT [Thermosyntropha lipolytica DSM 11003]
MRDIKMEDYDMLVKINDERDIVVARQMVKDFAKRMGFSLADITKISTAVSELARNIFRYAGSGFIYIRENTGEEKEIEIAAVDKGPGIENVEAAVEAGFTTSKGSLGLGLSGVRRLMDSFFIESEVNRGTVVIVTKRRRTF